MFSTKTQRLFAFAAFCSVLAVGSARADNPIDFGIDCMIHDSQGKLLKDLGMVGAQMDGNFMAQQEFSYNGLSIEADLNGPFAQAPEVKSPQLRLTVTKADGTVTASAIANVNPDLNIALWEPSQNVYLHCDKMDMME